MKMIFNCKKMKFFFLLAASIVFLAGCTTSQPNTHTPDEATSSSSITGNISTNPSTPMNASDITELSFEITRPGDGPEAKLGDTVSVHYTGTFLDGNKFDSSLDRNIPFDFMLGQGQVIDGWDQGVQGMKVGEVRKLVVPYQMAYGEDGYPPVIPARTPLLFEVELLDIQ